ncbi:large-conductance mechanosensitive channel [Xylaria sp. CBS 124048]|nr:large-conductance mechanosensitive channel [Xylaria sp. CBS 124048]
MMPILYGSSVSATAAEQEERSLLEQSEQQAKRVVASFVDFAFSGNILEIAFGLILANAFTAVTNSFVNDILLPPLSVLIPLNRNMDEKFLVLRPGPGYKEQGGYNTINLAKEDGAVVLAYGYVCPSHRGTSQVASRIHSFSYLVLASGSSGFIRNVVSFLCLGLMLYALASFYQCFSKDNIIKHTVKCRYCKKRISDKAIRCVNCTSWLDGREERMR